MFCPPIKQVPPMTKFGNRKKVGIFNDSWLLKLRHWNLLPQSISRFHLRNNTSAVDIVQHTD